MQVTLYNTTSDRRRTNKDLTSMVATYSNVRLKDDTSIINPVFILSGVTNNQFNYLYCPYLHRYYFVENVKYLTGDMLEVSCHVDVLMSFKTDILKHNAYILRQEKKFYNSNQQKNGIFYDSQYPIRSDTYINIIDVGEVCNTDAYYLTVNGGVQ